MRRPTLIAISVLLLICVAACREEASEAPPSATTQEMAGTTSPSDVSPVNAQTWIDDVTIGHEVGADGSIPTGRTGDDFAAGQTVYVAMETGDAPAGAAVKVMFYGPGEKVLGEEQKNVDPATKYLNFRTNTKGWANGDYRAEVWVGDEKVNTQQFQIVDKARAGK